jgi:transcriptional regulator of acetoin/glycerol metabolism
VLQEREVLPVGATKAGRWICTWSAPPTANSAMVRSGQFREDLFYRLNAAASACRPCASAATGVTLIRQLLYDMATEQGLPVDVQLAPDLLDRLAAYPWPGNIRELRNALRFAVAVCDGDVLGEAHFPESVTLSPAIGSCPLQSAPLAQAMAPASQPGTDDERERMLQVLRHCHWNISAAAERIGVSRSTLYRRMQRQGIVAPNAADVMAAQRTTH